MRAASNSPARMNSPSESQRGRAPTTSTVNPWYGSVLGRVVGAIQARALAREPTTLVCPYSAVMNTGSAPRESGVFDPGYSAQSGLDGRAGLARTWRAWRFGSSDRLTCG